MLSLEDLASAILCYALSGSHYLSLRVRVIILTLSVLLLSVFYLLPTLSGLTTTAPQTATLGRTIQSPCHDTNRTPCRSQ